MYIHEAIAKACPDLDSVYRRAWLKDYVIAEKVRVLKAPQRMFYESATDSTFFAHPWNPASEDLLADDWEVYRPMPKSEGFFKRYLGRWKLCVHQLCGDDGCNHRNNHRDDHIEDNTPHSFR